MVSTVKVSDFVRGLLGLYLKGQIYTPRMEPDYPGCGGTSLFSRRENLAAD